VGDRLSTVAEELPIQVQQVEDLSEPERSEELRRLLRAVHGAVMRHAVDLDAPPVAELEKLADAVRTSIPEPVEDVLPPRIRVFVRLLRRDAFPPAWTLATDNASGVVHSTSAVSTWAGPGHIRTQLSLPTFIEDGAVFAWLPGFRDPRWSVPDEVFDLGADVEARSRLDRAVFADGRLALAGSAWLTRLSGRPDDRVQLVLSDGEDSIRVDAARVRTPERVEDSGPGLTQLAWTGWTAAIELAELATRSANWRVRIEVDQDGVRRGEALGLDRGPLAHQRLIAEPYEARTCAARLRQGPRGGLVVQVRPFETVTARALPVSARTALRRLRPSAVAPPEW
jgi:hypothetical protein